jgi:hypothetical protein
LEHWGTQFARIVSSRNQGQSDFALDLIDLLQQKAAEFNEVVLKEFKFSVEVTNGFKTVAVAATALPGTIFVRVWNNSTERAFEGTLHNSPDGFEPEGLPSECSDPDGLAEWMIHEIFEP